MSMGNGNNRNRGAGIAGISTVVKETIRAINPSVSALFGIGTAFVLGLGVFALEEFAKLFKDKSDIDNDRLDSPTYHLRGNLYAEGQPIPVIYGRTIVYPYLVDGPSQAILYEGINVVRESRSRNRALYCIGVGDYTITDIRIGSNPLSSFPLDRISRSPLVSHTIINPGDNGVENAGVIKELREFSNTELFPRRTQYNYPGSPSRSRVDTRQLIGSRDLFSTGTTIAEAQIISLDPIKAGQNVTAVTFLFSFPNGRSVTSFDSKFSALRSDYAVTQFFVVLIIRWELTEDEEIDPNTRVILNINHSSRFPTASRDRTFFADNSLALVHTVRYLDRALGATTNPIEMTVVDDTIEAGKRYRYNITPIIRTETNISTADDDNVAQEFPLNPILSSVAITIGDGIFGNLNLNQTDLTFLHVLYPAELSLGRGREIRLGGRTSDNNLNCIVTRKLPRYSRQENRWNETTLRETRSPIFAIIDLLTNPTYSYSAGLPRSAVNMDEMLQIHDELMANNIFYDEVIDRQYSLPQLLAAIAYGFNGITFKHGNIWRVVLDRYNPSPTALIFETDCHASYNSLVQISPSNGLSTDSIVVNYSDNLTGLPQAVRLEINTIIRRIETVNVRGIGSSRERVRQRATQEYNKSIYRTTTLNIRLNGIGFLLEPGQTVGVCHSIFGSNHQFGEVIAYDSTTRRVSVDSDILERQGEDHYIQFRLEDGRLTRLISAVRTPNVERSIMLSENLPMEVDLITSPNRNRTRFTFGTANELYTLCKVVAIIPRDNLTADVSLLIDDERAYSTEL